MRRIFRLLLLAALLTGCAISDAIPTSRTTAPTEQPTGTATPAETSVPTDDAAPPEATRPPDHIDTLMETMTLREKVGQLFIVAPEALSGSGTVTEWSDTLAQGLEAYPVGGVILFGSNIRTPEQVTALTAAFQTAGKIPLFLSVDEEGGIVARLAGNSAFGLPRYKNAASVGSTGDTVKALAMGKVIGAYLSQYGFNLDFAPVADVNTNPNNPVIGTRAFSSDAETAAALVSAFADGLNRRGITAVYKHFPGHGDTAEDSHAGIAISYKTASQMLGCEWIPFLSADSGDMVMVGHIAVPEITGDLTPATLSCQVVTEILKGQLGFDGLVITDSLSMGAITEAYGPGEAAFAALNAGCDILLMPEDLEEAFYAVLTAVETGEYSTDALDAAVRRILEFKQSRGLLP